jgi:hypothetical protein
MRVSQSALTKLLEKNAVELRFLRRRPIAGSPPTRRMLATNDGMLLNSAAGKTALNFRPASGRLKFNPTQKGLVLTWDIFMQDYRLVPAESVDVVSVIPTTPPEEFWKYFSEVLSRMSGTDKEQFMDK